MTNPLLRLAERGLALVLLVILAPIIAGSVLWVRARSGPPAVHYSMRLGRGGAPFRMVKIRTMRVRVAGEPWSKTALDGDRRFIPGGAWLRRHKVDELPQLWNIVRGDMAFVGPRPELVDGPGADPVDPVLSVLPGLTDLASIEFFDLGGQLTRRRAEWPDDDSDAAYASLIASERRRLRERYVEHKSIRLDLQITLRTIRILVCGRKQDGDDVG